MPVLKVFLKIKTAWFKQFLFSRVQIIFRFPFTDWLNNPRFTTKLSGILWVLSSLIKVLIWLLSQLNCQRFYYMAPVYIT